MDPLHSAALALGVAWASGINVYAAMLLLGGLGHAGIVPLPADLQVLENPWVLGFAAVMFAAQFLADKVPGLDSLWDAVHTFIRIPAGALLAFGVAGGAEPAMQAVALLAGGALSTAAHGAKLSARLLINTSPEPFSNWTASLSEDAMVLGGLWLALHHPFLFLAALAVFLVAAVWVISMVFKVVKGGLIRLLQR